MAGFLENLIYPFRKPTPPAPKRAMGFFTDTTLCIGCKACEVACKQWNQIPSDGFTFSSLSYAIPSRCQQPHGAMSPL